MHILVVEDELAQQSAYRALLKQMGHTMCLAESVSDAAKLLLTESVDLVLLDIGLRDDPYGGIEVARIVPRKTPIFIVSGQEIADIREHATGKYALSGVQLFLSKPLDADVLAAEITRIEASRVGRS